MGGHTVVSLEEPRKVVSIKELRKGSSRLLSTVILHFFICPNCIERCCWTSFPLVPNHLLTLLSCVCLQISYSCKGSSTPIPFN